MKQNGKTNKEYLEEFQDAVDDDLNMPRALQVVWNLMRDGKADYKEEKFTNHFWRQSNNTKKELC